MFRQLAYKYAFHIYEITEEERKEYIRLRDLSRLDICRKCKGEGIVSDSICSRCEGTGMNHVVYTVDFDRARDAYIIQVTQVSNTEYREIVDEICSGDHRHNFGTEDEPYYADTYLSLEEARQRKAELNMKEVV